MDKAYNEQTAISALISVLEDVVRAGNTNPAFDSESGYVDISDGSRYQPIILLDRDDVENLIPFLEEQGANKAVIDFLQNIGDAQPTEQDKQG